MKILATFSCYYRKRLATFSCYCCCCSCCFCCGCRARLDKRLPDGKTPWHGRTEKVQNCAKKLPNVLSEILEKQHFSTIFRQLLLPTVVLPYKKKEPKNGLMFLLNPQHLPTANHHASEGPATSKTEPKNANTGTCRQQITMPLKDQLVRKPSQKTP